jgi:hypothetical protein
MLFNETATPCAKHEFANARKIDMTKAVRMMTGLQCLHGRRGPYNNSYFGNRMGCTKHIAFSHLEYR